MFNFEHAQIANVNAQMWSNDVAIDVAIGTVLEHSLIAFAALQTSTRRYCGQNAF